MRSTCWFPLVWAALAISGCATSDFPSSSTASLTQAPAEPEVQYVKYVYFATNSARLEPGALAIIDHVAQLYQEGRPRVLLVVGEAGRIGAKPPTAPLTAQRRAAVKEALLERGIPASVREVSGEGWVVIAGEVSPSAALH